MTATTPVPLTRAPRDQIFPTLTPDQIARIAAHGHVRPVRAGEVLIEAGDAVLPFFVVTAGEIGIVRPSGATETLVAAYGPGQFTGGARMVSRPRGLARARGAEPGAVREPGRERLPAL